MSPKQSLAQGAKTLNKLGYTKTTELDDKSALLVVNPHTYPYETTHLIVDGTMTWTVGDETREYQAGEYVDVPAGTNNAGKSGPTGCKFVIGEKC